MPVRRDSRLRSTASDVAGTTTSTRPEERDFAVMRRPRVAINGRFLTVPVTGVQRYARELVQELSALDAVDGVVILPPGELVELDEFAERRRARCDRTWSGGRGHLWEQALLPVLVRRTGADLLVSPCNWGPLAVGRQLPLFHDTAPLFHPEYFVPRYARLARAMTPRLVRRRRAPRRDVRTGEARSWSRFAGATHRIWTWSHRAWAHRSRTGGRSRPSPGRRRCVFVGGFDVRKNLGFLDLVLAAGPRRARTRAARRRARLDEHPSAGRSISDGWPTVDGVIVHVDLDDVCVARLLADSLCLLWPSHYEGYGLPLLEAMAVGTPFLSTDTGAARELAVDARPGAAVARDRLDRPAPPLAHHRPGRLRRAVRWIGPRGPRPGRLAAPQALVGTVVGSSDFDRVRHEGHLSSRGGRRRRRRT